MKEFFNKYLNLNLKKWLLFVLVGTFLFYIISQVFLGDFFLRQRELRKNDAVIAEIETTKILEGIYEFPFNLEHVRNSRGFRMQISDGIKHHYGECIFKINSLQKTIQTIRVSYVLLDTELQIKKIEDYESKKPIYQ